MRLIDADALKGRLENFVRWCRDSRLQGVKFVLDCPLPNTPTIETIPKADYENRLKADMVAMLTEIQLEIEELRAKKHFQYKHGQEHGLNDASGIIQGKINALKGSTDGK